MIDLDWKQPLPVVVDYDIAWPDHFRALGGRLRSALGPSALRIDHIGSTSVPSLAAKPIIDIQVSVQDLAALDVYRLPLEAAGFRWHENPDQIKKLFNLPPDQPKSNVHVVQAGSFVEQFNLLFRDYLRLHPARASASAALKRNLAPLYLVKQAQKASRGERTPQPYTDGKAPFIWETVRLAYEWSFDSGWHPGSSDA